ncbi:hypothetical protein [Clostridium hydrogenum]|uniref:hypothetical protein n=1 Tax=Clostridium hydrogenum TaxID=2855764 RepID=UPI001F2C9F21|nr:hypothetical protein [Clostridium hydrogenum]
MKKNLITILISLSIAIFFAGCTENKIQDKSVGVKPQLSAKHVTTTSHNPHNNSLNLQNKTAVKNAYNVTKLIHSYPINNNTKSLINSKLDNGEEFIRTFNTIKSSIIKNDKKTISDYINYPITVYVNNTAKVINNSKEFIANYDNIITPRVKTALIKQQLNNINITSNGIKIGNGEVWLGLINNGKHEYGISSINNK